MLYSDLASEGGHAKSLRGVRVTEPAVSSFDLVAVVLDKAVNFQGLVVHVISFFLHNGTPVGQMILALPNPHLLNLIHFGSQSVGVVRFLDLKLGLRDDRRLL